MLALLDSLLAVGLRHGRPGAPSRGLAGRGRATPRVGWSSTSAVSTTAALHALRSGTPAEAAGAVEAKGNGSLMRILPLPLVLRECPTPELLDMAFRASRVTHGSAEAQIACAFYVLIVRRLLEGDDDRAAIAGRGPRGPARAPPCAGSAGFEGGCRHPRRPSPRSTSSKPGASAVGVAAWWTASGRPGTPSRVRPTTSRAVIAAVRYGHDTDTTAAIAGGLAGAYLRHRGRPLGLAARPARPARGPGARRPARRDRPLRVGRHALADVARQGRCGSTSWTSRAPTSADGGGGWA